MATTPIYPPDPDNPVDPRYGATTTTSVLVPFLVYLIGGILMFLLFCRLRTRIPSWFYPRRKLRIAAPPRLSPTFLGWFIELLRIPEEYVARSSGMDALIILRFFKSSAFLFGILTVLGCGVVVPINWAGGAIPTQQAAQEAAGNGTTDMSQEISILRQLSIENIPGDSPLLIVHYVMLFVFNILLFLNVRSFYKSCINTRVQTIERVLGEMSGRGAVELPRIELPEFALPHAPGEDEAVKAAENVAAEKPPPGAEMTAKLAIDAVMDETPTGVADSGGGPNPNFATAQRKHAKAQEVSRAMLDSPSLTEQQKLLILLARRRHVDLRTVVILNLPDVLSTEEELRDFFETELNLGPVEQVHIARRYTRLRAAIRERAKWLKKLEGAWARYLGNPGDVFDQMTDEEVLRIMEYSPESEHKANGSAASGAGNADGEAKPAAAGHVETVELEEVVSEGAAAPISKVPGANGTADTFKDADANGTTAALPATTSKYDPEDFSETFGRQLESAYPCGPLRDALNLYYAKFVEADEKVRHLRERMESSDKTTTAFVVFFSPESAVVATQALLPSRPGLGYMRILPSPGTRDLVWDNISSKWAAPSLKAVRTLIVAFILVLLVFFWSVPVTLISSFLSLDSLAYAFPDSIGVIVESMPPALKNLIQGLIPSIILSIWMGILPQILYALSMLEGIEAYSWVDHSLFAKLYFYNVFNTLFIFAISGSVWNALDAILNDPSQIPYMLASALSGVSPFFMVYIFLNAFIMLPMRLLLPGYIYLSFLRRLFPNYKKLAPRRVARLVVPINSMHYRLGDLLTTPMVVYILTFFYAQIQPLILPAGFVYFFLAYVIFKYVFLYLHFPLYDTRGTGYGQVGWSGMIMRRTMFTSIIQILMMLGVLALKGQWYLALPICLTLLILASMTWFSMDNGLASWEKFIPLRSANQARTREEVLLAKLRKDISEVNRDSHTNVPLNAVELEMRESLLRNAKQVDAGAAASTPSAVVDPVAPAKSVEAVAAVGSVGAVATEESAKEGYKAQTLGNTFPTMTGKAGKDIASLFTYAITGSAGSGLLAEEAMAGYDEGVIEKLLLVRDQRKEQTPEAFDYASRTGQVTHAGVLLNTDDLRKYKYDYAMKMDLGRDGEIDMDEEMAEDAIFRPDRGGYTGYYLEPDIWRLKGVLDPITPLKGSLNRYRISEEDPQTYTYAHPAVSGALPQLWLPGRKHTINVAQVRPRYVQKQTDEERRRSLETRLEKKEIKWMKKLPPGAQTWLDEAEHIWNAFGTSIAFTFR
ncbi:hypothetical protein DFJ74DRAFT_694180 [Hyaloraphidium curvatum]|nr:hypothetical protein DFJ74DRAFT_694180 [Hyaloraphidium curvatum]